MEQKIIIHGRKVYSGHVVGEALVSSESIGTFSSINEKTGVMMERGHTIFGECIAGKVLVFPFGKGSSAWVRCFQMIVFNGVAPKGMLIASVDSRTALGAVVGRVPSMTEFDIDPLTVIETGDEVEVNANEGLVIVTKKFKSLRKTHAGL